MAEAFKCGVCYLVAELLAHTFVFGSLCQSARTITVLHLQTFLYSCHYLSVGIKCNFHAESLLMSFYFISSSASASICSIFAAFTADFIDTVVSVHVMFFDFSNIPLTTFAAIGAQLPFSMIPIVRFW